MTSVTTPVRPSAPAVPQNSSGSDAGVTSTTCFGVWSVNDATWLAMLPSTWWFLPWTSAASAPPTVTNRVPGVTGTNQPRGSDGADQRVEAHARRRRVPRRSRDRGRCPASSARAVEHGAARVLRRVAVAAPEARARSAPRRPACASGVVHGCAIGGSRPRWAAVGAVRPQPVSSVRRASSAMDAEQRTRRPRARRAPGARGR